MKARMLTFAEIVALIALVTSIASFALAAYNVLRDRARLKIRSKFYPASAFGPDRFTVHIANAGRRPIILRLLGGSDRDGKWGGVFLDRENGGLRLGEREHYEYTVEKEGTVSFNPEGQDIFYEVLWVEDSLGERHVVPNSKAFIKRIWAPSSDIT